jgi:Leucine-rich repeat (LRR) protein
VKKVVKILSIVLFFIGLGLLCGCGNSPDTEISPEESFSTILPLSSPEPTLFTQIPMLSIDEIDFDAVELIISERQISSFDFLQDCKNIKTLFLIDCLLDENAVVPQLETLQSVKIIGGTSEIVAALQNNPQIAWLDLAYCGIDKIDSLSIFSKLTHLSLLGNDISDLSPLSGMSELEELVLLEGNYKINSLKPLFALENLKLVILSMLTYQNIADEDILYFDPDTTPDEGRFDGIIQVD